MSNKVKKFKVEQTDDIDRAIHAFLNTNATKGKFGPYEITGQHLVYRSMVTEEVRIETVERMQRLIELVKNKLVVLLSHDLEDLERRVKKIRDHYCGIYVKLKALKQDVIASRLDNNGNPLVLGNSSVLPLIRRTSHFGRVRNNRGQAEIQERLALYIPMLPFTVFAEAKLDFRKIEIIEQGPEEKITRKNPFPKRDKKGKIISETEFETVHFTGASLFAIDGMQFLFDLDRRELKHRIFNPFLVKLPASVQSIAQAYEVLKPREVVQAEKTGAKIERQGEWFFISVDQLTAKRLEKNKTAIKKLKLQVGSNRPNYAQGIQLFKGKPISDQRGLRDFQEIDQARSIVAESEFYVTGKVSHAGREHADLNLKGWFKAVPNTATQSFTITGDID